LHQKSKSAISPRSGQSRIQFQSLIEVRNGLRIILSFRPDNSAMRPGVGEIRVKLQRAVQIYCGLLQVSAREPRSAAIVEENGLAGIERDGLVERCGRASQIAFFSQQVSFFIPDIAQPQIESQSLIEAFERRAVFSHGPLEVSEIGPCPAVALTDL